MGGNAYHYIIAGGGCAGLSLARRLARSSALSDKKILLVDLERKVSNDRTWCFWSSEPTDLEQLVSHRWDKMSFIDEGGSCTTRLSRYRYQQISGADFYNFANAQIDACPRIERRYGRIDGVGADPERAWIDIEGERIFAERVFDSRFQPPTRAEKKEGYSSLLQHFKGWVIETDVPVFDPERVVLMDFRVPQNGHAGFFYILPYAPDRALVEYTLFSPKTLPSETYEERIRQYLQTHWGIDRYRILEEEFGLIPMTDAPVARSTSRKIVQLGTRGGAVKPTTGYAFLNIQRQTREIVQTLELGKTPELPASKGGRFHFYDRLLLNILQTEGHLAKTIFSRLFHRNGMERVLCFLEEKSKPWQEARIFATLPVAPFLRAIRKVYGGNLPGWTGSELPPVLPFGNEPNIYPVPTRSTATNNKFSEQT